MCFRASDGISRFLFYRRHKLHYHEVFWYGLKMCLRVSHGINSNALTKSNHQSHDVYRPRMKTPSAFLETKILSSPPDRLLSLIQNSKNSLTQLKQIHCRILRNHHTISHLLISSLISSSPSPSYSLSLFSHFPSDPTPPLFNAIIRSLSSSSLFDLTLTHFKLMLHHNVHAGRLTLPFALRASSGLGSQSNTACLHGISIKAGFFFDSFVRTSIMDAYVKLGLFEIVQKLFFETPEWFKSANVLVWNVAIKASIEMGDLETARKLFDEMPERSVSSWNCLIHGLLKKGDFDSANKLFDSMPEKNVVSWTTMVSGFSNNGNAKKAIETFDHMLGLGIKPNKFTVCSVLSACAKIGALEAGTQIHKYISANGFQENGNVGTALVDMYSKCGKIELASRVFDRMHNRDISAWTAMIMGYAVHGKWQEALNCFTNMKLFKPNPDEAAFLAALTACLHAGKVDEGLEIFNSMIYDYKIEPTLKHYTSIVDLLGRAARFDEAQEILKSMPMEPDYVLWGALFCACRAHKHVQLAELAAEKLLRLSPRHSGGYVFLSNVYSEVNRWDDAEKTRISMKNCNVDKLPGWSCIEVNGKSYEFVAGDKSHELCKEIYEKLEEVMSQAREFGYTPSTEWVLHNIEEEDKEDCLGWHSEKLALCLGLLTGDEGDEIMIIKNLRVCGDCHSLFKVVSKMYGRTIVLRDVKRFHRFVDGECSCSDYW